MCSETEGGQPFYPGCLGCEHFEVVDEVPVKPKYKMCGYSNCFRKFYKYRGFMPVCKHHYKNPKKWGDDGKTFTGTIFVKTSETR